MTSVRRIDDAECFQSRLGLKDTVDRELFKAKVGKAPLQVSRVFRESVGDEKEVVRFVKNQDVLDDAGIKALRKKSTDACQIFVTRWDRSWTTLNISMRQFQSFMDIYHIFPQFWKCVFTFGQKSEENEFEFPGLRARRSLSPDSKTIEVQESAYMLRRVELHGRGPSKGPSSWSIRQTAVYHRYEYSFAEHERPKSMFLFIAPSKNAEGQISQCLENSIDETSPTYPWDVQSLLVADSLKGWMDYMACLETELKRKSKAIVFAEVGSDKENLSPLKDYTINFGDRQDLKIVEDAAIDLEVILPTLLSTIIRIKEQCKKCCIPEQMTGEQKYEVERVSEEFDEYILEARTLVERAQVLKEKSKSTAKLLSDLLNYEEAVALKELTVESQRESRSMYHLTKRSTKDAAAVKILTVITLVYLPTTIVANFFSTEFVQTNDSGRMILSNNAWLLAAIGVPLTIATIALWVAWVYFAKVTPPDDLPAPNDSLPQILRRRQSSFKSILSKKKKRTTGDLESGVTSPLAPHTPQGLGFRSPTFHTSPTGTWGSTTTTVKSG